MNADALLAIDVGTQSVRAIAFSGEGRMLARAQVPFDPPYVSPQPGWAEQDPEVYWRGLVSACRQLWEGGLAPARVAGLSLTTQRATMVCVDVNNRPLRPAIVWLDQRQAEQVPTLGPLWRTAFRLVGAHGLMHHFQRQAEANWLAAHQPEIWARTHKFLLLSGWLLRRLTGEWVDAVGSQVGYLPFDYRRQRWAGPRDFKWQALAIEPRQLPTLVPSGAPMGALTPEAAEALGLPAGLTLVAAAADKACEVLGSGVTEPDLGQLSLGTTATINTVQPRYLEVQRLLPAYPAAQPGRWTTEVQIYRGFWMLRWFAREFAALEQREAEARGLPVEALFERYLTETPPGAQGLTLQPYWTPGLRLPGPEGKGAIIGFGDVHTKASVYRALVEGLVYALKQGSEPIERRLGRPLRLLRVAGGGAQSDAVMQIVADVFARPAERPEITDTSALGAAVDLAVGLGWHRGFPEAVAAMCRVGRRFEPRPDVSALYGELYGAVYRPLYGRLKPLYRAIRRITGYPPP